MPMGLPDSRPPRAAAPDLAVFCILGTVVSRSWVQIWEEGTATLQILRSLPSEMWDRVSPAYVLPKERVSKEG